MTRASIAADSLFAWTRFYTLLAFLEFPSTSSETVIHCRSIETKRRHRKMKLKRTLFVLAAVVMLFSAAAIARQGNRASPHETVDLTLSGKKISVSYGRPYMKGRKIMGALVPFNAVWRTGADEATVLNTEADLTIGSLSVPKGSYALFTLPSESGW